MRKLIRAVKFAEKCGVHESTVRRWCERGKVPAVKLGGLWYINLRELLIQKEGSEIVLALGLMDDW